MTTKKTKRGKVVGPIHQEVLVGDTLRQVDVKALAAVLHRRRLRLKMTWPVFANDMGQGLATLYKLMGGKTRPHQLTVARLMERLGDEGAAALVPVADKVEDVTTAAS